MKLQLTDPMIVGRSNDTVLLVAKQDIGTPDAMAQVWSPEIGYSSLWKRQMLQGSIQLVNVNPPEPWLLP